MERNRLFLSYDTQRFRALPPTFSPAIKKAAVKLLTHTSPINKLSHPSKTSSFSSAVLPKTRLVTSKDPSSMCDFFPQWLLERNDFKSSILHLDNEMDIGKICSKPHKLRDPAENRELYEWCRACAFFKPFSDFTCSEVCTKLTTIYFRPGEKLIKEGDSGDQMYIILKGRVEIHKKGIAGCLDTIGPSNVIGEAALESNSLRSATVIAKDYVSALQLLKEDYTNIIFRQKHKQRFVIVNLLKSAVFFKDLLSAKLDILAWNMLLTHYEPQQTLYLQGQPPNGLYFVKEGAVQLITDVTITKKRKIPTSHKNKETLVQKKTFEIVVKVIEAGDFFGEEEVVENCARKTKAVCLKDSVVLLLKKDVITEMFTDKEFKMISEAHDKLRTTKELVKELAGKMRKQNIKYNAMLDATNATPVYDGRSNPDRALRRKVAVVKSMNLDYYKSSNKSLLKEECFFEIKQ